MDNDTAIKVDHVSKKYCKTLKRSMLYGMSDIGRNTFGLSSHPGRLRKNEFWAVDNVSFEVKKGETLGIIGPNGSGKTTMLKMLNGIFWPDKGKITIRGKVGALIEVGAGFHPTLTGRENIYINGAILGMNKKEINEKFDSILDFADIGDFIDSPVKHYSSGMYVRLGFAIAANVMPEILLIDEVLSVGDISFQNKSLRRLAEIREEANAVIFVSHNLDHVQNLCQKVIVLNKGGIVFYGDTEEAVLKYHEISRKMRHQAMKKLTSAAVATRHVSTGDVIIHKACVVDSKGRETQRIAEGEDVGLYVDFETERHIKRLSFSISILNEKKEVCIWHMSQDKYVQFPSIEPGRYRLQFCFKEPSLVPGVYNFGIGIRDSYSGETFQRVVKDFLCFVVEGKSIPRGIVSCESDWVLSKR